MSKLDGALAELEALRKGPSVPATPDRLGREATLLQLAMQEHLALRDDMGNLQRQCIYVVTSAVAAAAAGLAVAGGSLVTLDQGLRGLTVLGIVAVADAIGLAAVGVLNACKIVELHVGHTAEAIRTLALADAPKVANPFLSFQIHVNDFTARALNLSWKNRGTTVALLTSYGSLGVLALILVALIVVVGALGLWLTLTQSAFPTAPGIALFLFDCLFTAAMAVSMAMNNFPMEKWKSYFLGPNCDTIEAVHGTETRADKAE